MEAQSLRKGTQWKDKSQWIISYLSDNRVFSDTVITGPKKGSKILELFFNIKKINYELAYCFYYFTFF